MTTTHTITADLVTEGMEIIPPGRIHPVEVLSYWPAPTSADHIEIAGLGRGKVALRLHRTETIQVIDRSTEE